MRASPSRPPIRVGWSCHRILSVCPSIRVSSTPFLVRVILCRLGPPALRIGRRNGILTVPAITRMTGPSHSPRALRGSRIVPSGREKPANSSEPNSHPTSVYVVANTTLLSPRRQYCRPLRIPAFKNICEMEREVDAMAQ